MKTVFKCVRLLNLIFQWCDCSACHNNGRYLMSAIFNSPGSVSNIEILSHYYRTRDNSLALRASAVITATVGVKSEISLSQLIFSLSNISKGLTLHDECHASHAGFSLAS